MQGDCIQQLRKIEETSVDLIYLDPPFFSDKKYTLKSREQAQCFSFNDRWGCVQGYADFMQARLALMKPLLKKTGSIFVHCDKNAQHILRSILDNLFGREQFRAEIIWHYKRWSNAQTGLLASHQNIYFYSKSDQYKFNTLYTGYSETTNIDQLLYKRTRDKFNKSVYCRNDEGLSELGKAKKGVPLSDVWDIPTLNPKAKERVGYPTQKPLSLLERIIELSTDEGDLVLDPFCGSGTTCVAAHLNGRRYIGIDESVAAVSLARGRLDQPIKSESKVLKQGRGAFPKADQQALNLLQGVAYHAVTRNKGIDAILAEPYQNTPVLVRVQKPKEPLCEAATRLTNAMLKKGSLKAFLIQTEVDIGLDAQFKLSPGITVLSTPAVSIANALKPVVGD